MVLPSTLQFWELVASIVGPIVAAYIGILIIAFKWYNRSQSQKNETQDNILESHAQILNKLDVKLERLEAMFDSRFNAINQKLESEFKSIHRDIGSLTSEIRVLQAEGKERSRLTKEHANRISDLEGKIKELEIQLAKVENKLEADV